MDNINRELIIKIEEFNENIKYRYKNFFKNNKKDLRNRLNTLMSIESIEKTIETPFKMICIDGSVNKVGGSFPHYIELYRGLGKISNDEDISISRVYSPILEGTSEEEDKRKEYLASIELEVAIKAAETKDIELILMDGGLVRYKIDAGHKLERLKEICLKKNIILAGYIKEIKTDFLYSTLYDDESINIYDKDLLYGVLNTGEMLRLPDSINQKTKEGFSSTMFRMASFPGVTGLDILYEQRQYLDSIASLCYVITPPMGRGVPAIIDMVDRDAKLSDKTTEELIKSHIDTEVYERFFVSERSMRKY